MLTKGLTKGQKTAARLGEFQRLRNQYISEGMTVADAEKKAFAGAKAMEFKKPMTKALALKKLVELGCTVIDPRPGRGTATLTTPDDPRPGVYEPRELLKELMKEHGL